ncbi:hypothetical protein Natpe_0716 [Natrinema pellirubrum DSM 15624]|uniref:Uncharacterized protein n=1 Tax=Natrinema pellirubrum (strain DSM 15624 / CIP 106293 / JCM 10476 / NCIMB 786 / 157) TaxID=797303 RepID=L0JIF3_NATP1|nr:hypothetical protein [Natrinema pellirubrum]AGB30638.1 hypothetical protein Natpe_0716 [Natrinema pellirubrum DSM 15624]
MVDGKQRNGKRGTPRSITRRSMVKGVATTGALASIPATTGATSDSDVPQSIDDELDLDFDPKKKDQAAKFVMTSLASDSKVKGDLQNKHSVGLARQEYKNKIDKRRNILEEELTERQFEAIAEIVANIELTAVPQDQPISDSVGPIDHNGRMNVEGGDTDKQVVQASASAEDDYSYFEDSTSVSPKTGIEACLPDGSCFKTEKEIAEWTHEVSWEGNEDWPPDVRSIDADVFGDGKRFTVANWTYEGISQGPDNTVYADGQYFHSEAEGKFGRHVLLSGGFTKVKNDYIFTDVVASSNGRFNHVETRLNGDTV